MEYHSDQPFILVASPQLDDPNFYRSVVLLLECNENGAFGFVINKQSDHQLSDLVSIDGIDIPEEIPVWNAGPVNPHQGFILHNNLLEESQDEILPGIALSASATSLVTMIEDWDAIESRYSRNHDRLRKQEPFMYPFRFLVGYAGWGPGQLENEIRQGAWNEVPVNHELIYSVPFENMWEASLSSIGVKCGDLIAPPTNHEYLN